MTASKNCSIAASHTTAGASWRRPGRLTGASIWTEAAIPTGSACWRCTARRTPSCQTAARGTCTRGPPNRRSSGCMPRARAPPDRVLDRLAAWTPVRPSLNHAPESSCLLAGFFRGRPRYGGCRARQRSGVEVSDLVDALHRLRAVRSAPVAVVVHGVVQLRVAVAPAPELSHVCTADRGVAVKLDRARVRGLHEVVPEALHPLDSGTDLLPADELRLMQGIGHAPSRVNRDARRSSSRIITASVNSPRSASVSKRSAMAWGRAWFLSRPCCGAYTTCARRSPIPSPLNESRVSPGPLFVLSRSRSGARGNSPRCRRAQRPTAPLRIHS
jgi:hypothetical protein